MSNIFTRTEMVIGKEGLNILSESDVAVFGIGGVGSYVVEALARCGIGSLTLVDYDKISTSNINRQIHATLETVGEYKVEVMKERLLKINPKLNVKSYVINYNEENDRKFNFNEYSFVVDAIDTVTSKLGLIKRCKYENISIISSMGTGNKLNPTMLEVTDIFNTEVCPLARVVRKELRKSKVKNLKVVYSKEKPIKNLVKDQNLRIPGSVSFVPSVAGLIIASEVVKELINQ